MAHSRTAKKNIRKAEKRRTANRAAISEIRTQVKRVRALAAQKDAAGAADALRLAQKKLDKAAKNHRIHRNAAARMKSRLAKAVAAKPAQA